MQPISSKVSNRRVAPQRRTSSEPTRGERLRPIVHATACPVEHWLEFLGHRWNAVILWHLEDGPLHPSELKLLLPGIRPKALTERLAALTTAGLISRTRVAGFPPRVRYEVTTVGCSLLRILDRLADWAEAKRTRHSHPSLDNALTAW